MSTINPSRIARAQHDTLEPGEREMRLARAHQRPREGHCPGIARLRRALDRRPAGETEPEQLGGLVERLARGIVDRRRQPAIVARAAHFEQLAMSARNE